MLHNNYDRRPPEIGALGLQDTIPVANANRSSLNFAGAFARIDRIVSKLGRAKGISVVCSIAVEAPLFDGGPIMYRIDLSGGSVPATLQLDHQTFTASDEYFTALAVPQLENAIDKLRAQ